ncbi:MAG: hypothetical protein ABIF19_00750 [Planctomycetota bacterium]
MNWVQSIASLVRFRENRITLQIFAEKLIMFLGIDRNVGIVYEGGNMSWGARALFSTPYLFDLQIAETPEDALSKLLKSTTEFDRLLFREDNFDPVSMVRRGRIYEPEKSQSRPRQCWVFPVNEADLVEARSNGGVVRKELFSYQGYRLASWNPSQQIFAVIGNDRAYSMWRIVSNDRMYSSEELVTMRPLYFLGALPDLSPSNIPEQWRAHVQDTVNKVVDSMYKANADSIVDLCRNAASASLFARFHQDMPRLDKTDLRPLARTAEEKGLRIVAHCGKTIADLHSRVKPNIQMHHGCRPINDRDAELAVQCLSCILRDLGYARSP